MNDFHSKKIKWQKSGAGLFLFLFIYALCIALYYGYLFTHIVNFPRQDDFRAILAPLALWEENRSISNFFRILFSQHNEHKIFIVRLFSILLYEMEGVINFKHLILIGNLFFVSFPLAFLLNRKLPYYYYIALIPLFFCATPYFSSHWATTSLSNFPVVLLALLASHLAFHQRRNMRLLAIPVAFIATFSQGNGIAILFLLTIYALFKQEKSLKIIYAICFAATAAFYFYNWHRNTSNPSIIFATGNPLMLGKYALCMIGSAAFEQSLAVILGSALIIIYLSIRIIRFEIGPNDIVVLFILISAAMVASNRMAYGLDSALASRYTIYSLLLIAILFCEISALIQDKKKQLAFLWLAILLSTSYAIYSWRTTEIDRHEFLAGISQLRLGPDGDFSNVPDRAKHVENSKKILQRCNQLRIYTPPQR